MLKGWGTLIAVKLVSCKRINIKVFSICLIYLKKPHITRSENIYSFENSNKNKMPFLQLNERGMKNMTISDNIAILLIHLFNYVKKYVKCQINKTKKNGKKKPHSI